MKTGMSSRRSRSGGTRMGSTLRRKNRSSRKRPASTSARRSRLVAATTRTSTLRVWMPPTRSISRSCRARSSLPCAVQLRMPISSRKSVPPSARSKRPARALCAPVKPPFSTPNSSDSIRSSGMAAQLMATNGPLARLPMRCRLCASTSLPTPLSPRKSTVAWVLAARRTMWQTALKPEDTPTTSASPSRERAVLLSPLARSPRGTALRPCVSASARSERLSSSASLHSSTLLPMITQWLAPWAQHCTSRNMTGRPMKRLTKPEA